MNDLIKVTLTPKIRLEQALKDVGVKKPESVTRLTIEGTITQDDLEFIKDKMRKTLQELDLSRTLVKRNAKSKLTFKHLYVLTSIVLPNSETIIRDYAFFYCTKLTAVTIPDSVVKIGDFAFADCTNLKSVTIPNSVTEIGDSAFSRCDKLQSVFIPASVKKIDSYAFIDCPAYITVDPDNPYYTTEDGILFNKDKTALIAYPTKRKGRYVVPASVRKIEKGSFSRCKGLTSIIIPDGVTKIGLWTFSYCINLKSVTIPNTVTKIDDEAFSFCEKLQSVFIPASVKKIESNAFNKCPTHITVHPDNPYYTAEDGVLLNKSKTKLIYGCSIKVTLTPKIRLEQALKDVGVENPESVTRLTIEGMIADDDLAFIKHEMRKTLRELDLSRALIKRIETEAFSGYKGLASITFPDGITEIGNSAFAFCYKLQSVFIPASVEKISESAFIGCSTSITVDPDNRYYTAEDGVLFNKDKTALIAYPIKRNGNYVIPTSVRKIRFGVFSGCKGLTSIIIPHGITEIKFLTFCGCTNLKSVIIPNTVTKISEAAFACCKKLQSVFIPASVKKIDEGAFENCPTHITVHPDNPYYTAVDGVLTRKIKNQ